jgi:hypothetical protein
LTIKFNDNGTISIPIKDETYSLSRPTVKDLYHFWDRIDEIAEDATEELQSAIQSIAEQLAEIEDETSTEAKELIRTIKLRRREAHEYTVIPWLREVYDKLGSASLPEDLSEAPSEITDQTLPLQIISFWRSVPLASSGRQDRNRPR